MKAKRRPTARPRSRRNPRRNFGRAPRGGLPVLTGQVVAALAVVAYLLGAQQVHVPWPGGDDALRITVAFSDAGGLRADMRAPVLVSGVPSGRVEDVRYRDGRAVATLRLDAAARGVVKRDATATIEPRSALQDLTVDLDPGSPSAPPIRAGGRLTGAAAQGPVTLDRVLDVLDADTRAQVAIVLDQLAGATRRRPGALRRAIAELRPAMDGAQRVTDGLDRRRALLTRLVAAVDRLATAAGQQDTGLRRVLATGRRTADAVAGQDAALQAAITRLPATLGRVRAALTATDRLGDDLDPAVRALRPTADGLPAALQATRKAIPALTTLLADVDDLATQGAPAARRLRRMSGDLVPALKLLEQPSADVAPLVREVDARKAGIGELGENFSGVLSTNDAVGTVLRGLGSFEPIDPVNLGFAKGQRAQAAAAAARALTQVCRKDNQLACLVRYVVPGLPGAVR